MRFTTAEATMSYGFLDIAITPSVKAAAGSQRRRQRSGCDFKGQPHVRPLHRKREQRSLPNATASTWRRCRKPAGPMCSIAAGRRGFLRVLDDRTLAFADFRGNLQYLSVGNLAADNRASLILMDYAAPPAAEDLRAHRNQKPARTIRNWRKRSRRPAIAPSRSG